MHELQKTNGWFGTIYSYNIFIHGKVSASDNVGLGAIQGSNLRSLLSMFYTSDLFQNIFLETILRACG